MRVAGFGFYLRAANPLVAGFRFEKLSHNPQGRVDPQPAPWQPWLIITKESESAI